MDETTCTIDELSLPLVAVGSVEELGEVVRSALQEKQAIYPLGGRTQLHLGLPPTSPGRAIDLRRLAKVIDYPARDMTLTVQAGITITDLQQLLAQENQRLPIDVPHPHQATLGGAIATNTSGPRRLGSGTLRDYIIGISTINDQGQETRAGGRVVKNVAGYDLCKLHTGALGTLGIISQVTLKVRPRPEEQALLTFGCDTATLPGLLDQVHASRTRPMCVEVFDAQVAKHLQRYEPGLTLPEHPWLLAAGFEDSEAAVTWQMQQLMKELTSAGLMGAEVMAGSATDPLWRVLTEFTAWPESVLSFKANLLPGKVADFCKQASEHSLLIHAHAASGIVHAHAPSINFEQAKSMLDKLAPVVADASGQIVLTRCPVGWKRQLPVWGMLRGDLWLMRQVKQQFDPHRVFNPGRFVDGI